MITVGGQVFAVNQDAGCSPIEVSPLVLPGGDEGDAYGQSVTAAGGVAPYTYAVTSGALPDGLVLSADGSLSGTLMTPGEYAFTVTATDANGCTGSREYAMTVVATTMGVTAEVQGPCGSISPSGDLKALIGSDVTFYAIPGLGCTLVDLAVNGKSLGPIYTVTVKNISDHFTITATFK